MKKALGQTVREIKREVNKKVLKVPGIEQKVLDATSNEPWGPHGSNLADIAQATRNYNEYQIIMSVLWKRINDTGKNWRHVYKALTVLEYLVGHGSERVIDDIREHAYQISTLSDFQYIDSGGRDQGNNVRKKSQSLVALVNDKERIQEVRQKALTDKDKYRGPSSTGGMYRPGPYSNSGGGYGDRYEGRYGDERNGYDRERDWGPRDDDRYGRGGDRHSRDYDEPYGRDGYRDDDFRGSRGSDEYGSRNRGYDRERDDDRYSSRSAGRVEEMSPDERGFERKASQQSLGAPPTYEEAVNGNGTPNHISEGRNEPAAPRASSPPPPKNSSSPAVIQGTNVTSAAPSALPPAAAPSEVKLVGDKELETFDEFDPRGPTAAPPAVPPAAPPAAPLVASSAESDIFGLADINALALMPVTQVDSTSEIDPPPTSGFSSTFVPLSSASNVLNQPMENPFGDSPFKAHPSDDNSSVQPQSFVHLQSSPTATEPSIPTQPISSLANVEAVSSFEFSDTFPGISYETTTLPSVQAPASTTPILHHQSSNDVLGGLVHAEVSASAYPPQVPSDQISSSIQNPAHVGNTGSVTPFGYAAPAPVQGGTFDMPYAPQNPATAGQLGTIFSSASAPSAHMGYTPQTVPQMPSAPTSTPSAHMGYTPQTVPQIPSAPTSAPSAHMGYTPQTVPQIPSAMGSSHLSYAPLASPAPPAPSSSAAPQQPKDKFEPKSAVWADTLSRGLVNLNISGPKTNPLADIGVDFDAINRKEKRTQREKPSTNPVTSTITMGKAMGTGSGIGRAAASGLAPPPNPMMGGASSMGMGGGRGMGMGMGTGMGIPGGPGIGMGMGGAQGMGMGMNMGMGAYGGVYQPFGGMGMNQGTQMRPPAPGMPGAYNPMLGAGGGYGTQQPYGGYR